VSAVQTNQLTVTGGTNWSTNQWNGYEVVVTSGVALGRRYLVTGNEAGLLQLSTDVSASGVAAGDSYELAPTLEEYLGSQLIGADSPSNADRVATYSQAQVVLLYRSTTGQWLDTQGQSALLSVVSGQGFWINPATPRSLLLLGRYQGDMGGVWVATGPQIISFPFSGVPMTLGLVGWQGAVAGNTPATSDQFGVWDNGTATLRNSWLDATTGQWEWQDTGGNAGGLTLGSGQGYFYQHAGGGFYLRWR
jgi:hypothetical protein